MPANFLHGVEVIETVIGPIPVSIVKSAVIGLVGTAPQWAVPSGAPVPAPGINKPILVSSQRDGSGFGPMIRGYSIPYVLDAIFKQGFGQAIVVDVFDPSSMKTVITAEAHSMPATGAQAISVGHMGLTSVVVKDATDSTTYVLNTDYTLDAVNGVIKAKSGGAITAGEALHISYDYADPSKVVDADLVGAITSGVYTGMQCFQLAYGLFGFFPKILIAPAAGVAGAGIQDKGSQDATVASALDSLAQTVRAIALVDSPPATQVATAITNRGVSGNTFDTSSHRTVLCFPWESFYDSGLNPTGVTLDSAGNPVTATVDANQWSPYSQWVAGALAAQDLEHGYWWSSSNRQIDGILGPDVSIYASILDPNSDSNNLNGAGIVTVFNNFGTGLRVWGNRSAAYPSATAPDVFIAVRRTMDVIEESAELAMMQFLDRPITNALIDQITESVNQFLRTLVGRGGLVDGKCSYDPAKNPATEIAAGHLTFDLNIMPPPPAERITFNIFLDINMLSELTGQLATA